MIGAGFMSKRSSTRAASHSVTAALGWPAGERFGYHSLRRQFASELKDTPLADLAYLGGWKDPQTILKCYQRPDSDTMRRALEQRRQLRAGSAR